MTLRGRRWLLVIGGLVLIYALVLLAFRGEYDEVVYADGVRWEQRQYFLSVLIWRTRGSEPRSLPSVGESPAYVGKMQRWRGFGLTWKSSTHYE